ncbi:four helix bundle protein [Flavobacteriaceae bacterium TK19130]|nr:four helix bundle protein [Thermobacterium salinum]
MGSLKSFEDLECWKMARELRNEVKNLIIDLPEDEKYELKAQMRRASRSVTHNIAEGYGRFHYQENIQFCRISRGSLYELQDQLIVALDEKYISEEVYHKMRKRVTGCVAILNGYINYLKKAKANH